MTNRFQHYCSQVCALIRWAPAREAARSELLAHLEDHAEALKARGVPSGEAAAQAVAAMGDPEDLGRQLDQAHPPPLFPGLPALFTTLGLVLLAVSLTAGAIHQTGLFAHSGLLPNSAPLPQPGNVLVCSGSASGGGTLGGYHIAVRDAALVRTQDLPDAPAQLEVQATLSVSHWQLWLDTLYLSGVPGTWTDSTGASGAVFCSGWSDAPLAGSGYVTITAPTPGAHWFAVTLGRPGDQIYLRIDLEEEVPQ